MGGNGNERQLTALLIAQDRDLAQQFSETVPAVRGFQILGELRTYPPQQTLDMRLRQLQPEVVLLDLATDPERAAEVIRCVVTSYPGTHVVGLHSRSDSDAIVNALRLGASEFLCAPFDAVVQRQALTRLRRLIEPRAQQTRGTGTVVVFASAKPGSGASTLAVQTGFALRTRGGNRVLVADLDPMSGTVSFHLHLRPREAGGDDAWKSIQQAAGGLHALPASGAAYGDGSAIPSLHAFLERARATYDWIILDLPAVFHRSSLLVLPEADQVFLATTPELPSLHLARKAVTLLTQLGFGRERVRVLVNRAERKSSLAASDLEKVLNAPVYHSFPNDYLALDRALAEGEPLGNACELGKEIEAFAIALAGRAPAEKSSSPGHGAPEPAYSGIRG